MTYKKICPVCGNDFVTDHPTKKYCGHGCYVASKRRCPDVVKHRSEDLGSEFALFPKRKCHDCGRPTTNYRCEKCWSKIREDVDL